MTDRIDVEAIRERSLAGSACWDDPIGDARALLAEVEALNARLQAVQDLADKWERDAGPDSRARAVYGRQVLSVEFAVAEIRAAAAANAPSGIHGDERPQPSEPESMVWTKDFRFDQKAVAEEIVAWVNANGGEAQFVPRSFFADGGPRIALMGSGRSVIAKPGDRIVKEADGFTVSPVESSGSAE